MSEEKNVEEMQEITESEFAEMIGELAPEDDAENPILILDVDNLAETKFDKKSFQAGLNKASEMCGIICALTNVGVSTKDAFNYVINERTMEHNLEMQKIINDNSLEIANIQMVKIDSQTL